MKNSYKPNLLDLFSGCGGLSHGFSEAGYDTAYAIDYDQIALDTFVKNHPNSTTFCEDLGNINAQNFIEKNISRRSVDVIIGAPPCQGFSISGKRDISDPRNGYYRPFFEFVNALKPKVFLMENVPNLISMEKGIFLKHVIELSKLLGYFVEYKVLLASDYGVPQNRRRVFFVGHKNRKFKYEFPLPRELALVTTKQAISDFPEYSLNDGSSYISRPKSDYQKKMRINSPCIFNHEATKHSKKTVKIISMVPDGGNYKSLPKRLQNTRKVNIAWTRFASDKPSFTIDTGHRHHFHYEYNRIPTVRECARLQSFNDNFIFTGSKTHQYKQVGNAVPPLLAKTLAKSIMEQLL